jgi:hypothetical protein
MQIKAKHSIYCIDTEFSEWIYSVHVRKLALQCILANHMQQSETIFAHMNVSSSQMIRR